jgi:lipopolysaccharide export system protein LptC
VPPPRQIVLVLLLAAAALSAWWLQPREETSSGPEEAADRRPDYTVERLTVTTMEERGRPDRRLVARELRHYPIDSSNELDEPLLTLFKEGEPPWRIRSESGRISDEGDELLLQGTVFIDREAGAGTRPVHIKTSYLLVRPEEDYARTERALHLTSGADWLSSAAGAELWFGDPLRIKLFGRARLQMDQPQQPQSSSKTM